MTTYRLPPEPEGPVWQWSYGALRWLEYHKPLGRWVRADLTGMKDAMSWGELLTQGEVTTTQPIDEPLDELRDAIVSAARTWHVIPDPRAHAELREAVGRYNRKLHQLNDEREN